MFLKDYKLAFRTPRDVGSVKMKAIRGPIEHTPNKAVSVERDIVDFYNLVALVNHTLRSDYHILSNRDAEMLHEVDRRLEPILRRMVNYLTAVCIRECRHYKKFPVKGASSKWNEAVAGVKGTDGTECVAQVYNAPDLSDMTLKELLEGASACFGSTGWGGAFGGKAWKEISDHTLKFVTGEISAEVFIDQAFSLQHNTTTVFNKSVIYNYKSVDAIQSLLDLQAHGLIGLGFSVAGSPEVKELVEAYNPDFLAPSMDGVDNHLKHVLTKLGIMVPGYDTATQKEPTDQEKILWTYQNLGPASKPKSILFLKSNLTITQKSRETSDNTTATVQSLTLN